MKLSRYCAVLLATSGFYFFSCAATASVTVTKPPIWNTSVISRITIVPFASTSPSDRQVAQFFTSRIAETILHTGKFTLIDYADIVKLERAKENAADHVDAILSGSDYRIASHDSVVEHEDRDRKKSYTYYRDVSVNFSYMLKRAGDGAIIGQTTIEDSAKVSAAQQEDLQPAIDVAMGIVGKNALRFGRYISPWSVKEERVFEEDTMKDQRMKQAKALLKEESFRSAYSLYETIYSDSLNFAAGFNAALCAEIMGDIAGAATLMQKVWEDTGNPKARAELSRLRSAISDIAKLNQDYSGETSSIIADAVKQASRELLAAMPDRSRISFIGGRGGNQNTLDFIIDELTAAVVATGTITVIDREQIDAIIAEQRFQLSGEVSDETAVSIGRLSGSQIIVSCSITGASSQRRLRVRAITVETGVIFHQISLQI
jgi:hypothetical protein